MSIRIVFMGSPDFAVPSLRSLAAAYPMAGVVTQPDRPAGRGQQLTPCPVKVLAQSLDLPIIQPEKLRQPEAMAALQAWAPDLIVVTAFGQILRQPVLDLPRYGVLNVHASLLPRWRGAAPIQAALLAGDTETGATIMRLDAGVDTGPMLTQVKTPITPEDTTASLSARLAQMGADLLMQTLPGYLSGEISPQAQDQALSTYASMLKKEDGLLDFTQPAEALARRVRAFTPWPGAYTLWEGQPFRVLKAEPATGPAGLPGQHSQMQGLPAICTREGWLVLRQVQPAGKKPQDGADFLRGSRRWLENQ